MKPTRVLYVGPLWEGGTCLQRMHAMQNIGLDVTSLDTFPPGSQELHAGFGNRLKGYLFRKGLRIFSHPDPVGVNEKMINLVHGTAFDLLWLDKGLSIKASTLNQVRQSCPDCIIAGYSPDDMIQPHSQSKQFLGHLSYYDFFFTTKSYGVRELADLGIKNVRFIGNAYDLDLHRPHETSPADRVKYGGDVGFIGQYEEERARSIARLAATGIAIRIWGQDWDRLRFRPTNATIENRPLWGEDYAKAICSFKVNLCFLRKVNRDQQTTRSIEIPACGGFMLAERTEEHKELFEEGVEAEFFSSNAELADKTRFYLQNDVARLKIAKMGLERCQRSGYSNIDRMREMLREIGISFAP